MCVFQSFFCTTTPWDDYPHCEQIFIPLYHIYTWVAQEIRKEKCVCTDIYGTKITIWFEVKFVSSAAKIVHIVPGQQVLNPQMRTNDCLCDDNDGSWNKCKKRGSILAVRFMWHFWGTTWVVGVQWCFIVYLHATDNEKLIEMFTKNSQNYFRYIMQNYSKGTFNCAFRWE